MKMFLTRLGEGSRVVVDGDLEQSDLPKHKGNGLADALDRLEASNSVAIIEFSEDDITRDPLVREIVMAYRK
jgi:phosphate starvation-inducible PhoH-like protein